MSSSELNSGATTPEGLWFEALESETGSRSLASTSVRPYPESPESEAGGRSLASTPVESRPETPQSETGNRSLASTPVRRCPESPESEAGSRSLASTPVRFWPETPDSEAESLSLASTPGARRRKTRAWEADCRSLASLLSGLWSDTPDSGADYLSWVTPPDGPWSETPSLQSSESITIQLESGLYIADDGSLVEMDWSPVRVPSPVPLDSPNGTVSGTSKRQPNSSTLVTFQVPAKRRKFLQEEESDKKTNGSSQLQAYRARQILIARRTVTTPDSAKNDCTSELDDIHQRSSDTVLEERQKETAASPATTRKSKSLRMRARGFFRRLGRSLVRASRRLVSCVCVQV